MRHLLLAGLVAGLLTLPSSASGQVPTQDSVSANVPTTTQSYLRGIQVEARSGPRGENPSGTAGFTVDTVEGTLTIASRVTCLAVNGNRAAIGIAAPPNAPPLYPEHQLEVVDNQGTGRADTVVVSPTIGPADCSPTGLEGVPIASGDIAVVDATPTPKPITSRQCRLGGWAKLGFPSRRFCDWFVRWQCNGGRHVNYGFTLRAQCRAYVRYL